MGFTKKTPDSAFSNFLDDTKKAVIGRAIKAFIYVGEACLKEARLNARRRSEVVNLVAADTESVDDIVADVPEFRVRRHVAQQRRIGGVAYVHAEDFVPVVQQTQAQVGPDESHAAQYDYSLLHLSSLFTGRRANFIPY